ncbi:MAG TPA: response regulator [Pedobacter sp.]
MVLKLLVIEDDEGVREMLQLVLNNEGHEVILAKDGAILCDLMQIKPDMIFIDEWLCNEKGSDLCRKLKADPHTFDIPVILISAMVTAEQFSKQAGADGYLRKPFDADELSQVIRRYAKYDKAGQAN